jgi:hypothetical protein
MIGVAPFFETAAIVMVGIALYELMRRVARIRLS